jgi:hypothetical protein
LTGLRKINRLLLSIVNIWCFLIDPTLQQKYVRNENLRSGWTLGLVDEKLTVNGKLQSEVSTLTYLLMSVVSSSNYRNHSPDRVLAVLANPMPTINCISIQIISTRCLFCDHLLLRDFWALCDNMYCVYYFRFSRHSWRGIY